MQRLACNDAGLPGKFRCPGNQTGKNFPDFLWRIKDAGHTDFKAVSVLCLKSLFKVFMFCRQPVAQLFSAADCLCADFPMAQVGKNLACGGWIKYVGSEIVWAGALETDASPWRQFPWEHARDIPWQWTCANEQQRSRKNPGPILIHGRPRHACNNAFTVVMA